MRQQIPSPDRTELSVSRADAASKLQEQIERGKQITNIAIGCEDELNAAREERNRWRDYCHTLLANLFTTLEFQEQFDRAPSGVGYISVGGFNLARSRKTFQDDMKRYVNTLQSICDRLDLVAESPRPFDRTRPGTEERTARNGSKVFIVHGHDEEAKQTVARFIESLGLEAVILHEQPSQGRTLIEKLEHYASEAAYAVVLLTPDDIGEVKGTAHAALKERARQNVIFELGYFAAKLGREYVCALHKDRVELPTDYSGVVYEAMDKAGGWKIKLAAEMRVAGLEVDFSRLR